MGRRGPAPQPTAIKEQRGNPGHRRLNRREPEPKPGIPTPPSWLSDRAKTHWWDISKELFRLGVLTILDRDALALLCDEYAEVIELRIYLRRHKRVYTTISRIGQKMDRQRPEVRLLNEARKRYKALLEQFGMTPSSRTRVTSKTDDPEDELEAWKRKYAG